MGLCWLTANTLRLGFSRLEYVRYNPKQVFGILEDYIGKLSEECRMLVILKAQLYEGSWEPMLDDLKNRLYGKPYIFKLVNRIQDDIERIGQMLQFESEHNIDLADFVEMP